MNKTFKTILAVVMAVAMVASLCVTAMADYPAGFNYVAGNKPTDIWITDGQSRVELKKAQEWPEDLTLVDTYAIAENVAYTLFVNGQNYQPIIDAQDIYHFVVFAPICFAVPLCWADGVNANIAEFTIVAFGFPDGSIVDYQVVDPYGNPVVGGQAVINDNLGKVVLPADLMAQLADGVYTFEITGKDGDGNDYSSTSPFGVQDGKLVSALDDDLGNGRGTKKKGNGGPHDTGDEPSGPVGPVNPKGGDSGIGHGFTISTGKYGLGAHFDVPSREVTLTVGNQNITFPTSGLVGQWDVSKADGQKAGLTFDLPQRGVFGLTGDSSGSVNFPEIIGGVQTIIDLFHR